MSKILSTLLGCFGNHTAVMKKLKKKAFGQSICILLYLLYTYITVVYLGIDFNICNTKTHSKKLGKVCKLGL